MPLPSLLRRGLALLALVSCAAPPAAPVAVPPQPAPTAATARPAPIATPPPRPLVAPGRPVKWWFAFKFNTATFAGCDADVKCPFGGQPQHYAKGEGYEFAVASSAAPALKRETACIGQGADSDPVGTTFRQVYEGHPYFVVWNDQFYDDPKICGSCGAPWAHSKGMLAWDDSGEGFVMQVSTPSWPGAGNRAHPRTDGNTLGCIDDDNAIVSQHFFALELSHADLLKTLAALTNIRVVTDPRNPQIVKNGGPEDVRRAVDSLGGTTASTTPTSAKLSSGVTLLSKPALLHVPPWQLVSSLLGAESLRVASWWNANRIDSTTPKTKLQCWGDALKAPGAVEIATSGTWEGQSIGLKGGNSHDGNHAKLGVSTASNNVVLGDMNQEGALSGKCDTAQNGRGGLFYVIEDDRFHASMTRLLAGQSAP